MKPSRGALRPALLLRAGLVLVAAYYALWGGEYSAFDLQRVQYSLEDERDELLALRTTVDSVRHAASQLESDMATVERVARERFGMIRDGETLYRFVVVDSAQTPDSAAAESSPPG